MVWKKLFIEEDVLKSPIVKTVRERIPFTPVEVIENLQALSPRSDGLILARQRGKFLKPCPCSPEAVRCGYHFLNVAIGCPFDCSYCFLQGFVNTPQPLIYGNIDDLKAEICSYLEKKQGFIRIGTGELTDSLAWEEYTSYSERLVEFFASMEGCLLELKTKSTKIESILNINPKGKVMISWSMSPERLASIEEPNAPQPQARINAAFKAYKAGYRIGFHFDPIILYQGWEDDYLNLLKDMSIIPGEAIDWISLGTFRIFPDLRGIIRSRHPHSLTFLGELVPGFDGKLRYFRPLRVNAYKKMIKWIYEIFGKVWIYLCMESPDIWNRTLEYKFTCHNLCKIMDCRTQVRSGRT